MPEYQSLYRKYRSQTFADLVGQEAASRALQGAIIGGRVAHAYLFSGSRGTGKTSAARLLAKALNCTGRARTSAEPCNSCQSCLEMTAGSALDLIETTGGNPRSSLSPIPGDDEHYHVAGGNDQIAADLRRFKMIAERGYFLASDSIRSSDAAE